MLNLFLQIWGGVFYLLNKVFLSFSERSNSNKRKWRIASWIVYLVGTPPWIILFIEKRNWIAAALETAGIPSMLLGLMIALRGRGKEPKWMDHLAFAITFAGLGYSIYDFGGITTLSQILELVMTSSFLMGTYLLAKEKPAGYLWFMAMNISCALLLMVGGYPWLVAQQVVSLGFVADAWFSQRKKASKL